MPDPSASLDAIHPADRSSPHASGTCHLPPATSSLPPDLEHGHTSGSATPTGSETQGNQSLSPPPSYHDIPGTVPAHQVHNKSPTDNTKLPVQGVSRGPPPSYEEAVDPNAEPPSYDSLFGRIRDTHKASRNAIDFVVKVILLLLGTIGCTIACSITIVIPVCMIVIGR